MGAKLLTVTVSGETIEEIRAELLKACQTFGATQSQPTTPTAKPVAQPTTPTAKAAEVAPAEPTEKRKVGRPRKDAAPADPTSFMEPEPTSPAGIEETGVVVEPSKNAPPESSASSVTKDEAFSALQDVNAKKQLDGVRAVLGKFSVSRFSALPESEYAAFVAECKKVVA